MSLPEVVSREEWLPARKQLLLREKKQTHERDALNADRRRLPMVWIDKEYVFEGESGRSSLLDLFGDNRQLIVYHAMFDPDWEKACPGCTASMDEAAPALFAHLNARDTNYVMVSRAPYPKIAAYKAEYGWTFGWYSSYDSDFNYDFHVSFDATKAPIEYNYKTLEELGEGWAGTTEMPALSCFLRDGDTIFHTYSVYARGTEQSGDAYALLDMTALGRQEDWEEPKARVADPGPAGPVF